MQSCKVCALRVCAQHGGTRRRSFVFGRRVQREPILHLSIIRLVCSLTSPALSWFTILKFVSQKLLAQKIPRKGSIVDLEPAQIFDPGLSQGV
jgi:hypothetical protein